MNCTTCGSSNRDGARFCAQCGAQAGAGRAASSQPGMSPAAREDYLRRTGNQAAERAALAVPAPTGSELKDLANAEEHFTRVNGLWEKLDDQLKAARAEAGLIPAAGDMVEIRDLQRRVDIAWASRQAAKAHRQVLWDQERLTWGTPGMGLPPGPGEQP